MQKERMQVSKTGMRLTGAEWAHYCSSITVHPKKWSKVLPHGSDWEIISWTTQPAQSSWLGSLNRGLCYPVNCVTLNSPSSRCELWVPFPPLPSELLGFYFRLEDGKHAEEISHFQEQLAEARSQLQLLQKQLDEELGKQPVENQEVNIQEFIRFFHWTCFTDLLQSTARGSFWCLVLCDTLRVERD